MKLISCHIEAFGGISQRDYSFSEGLTVLEEPNGSGKTTLAEFIRAMFYGFARAGRAIDKNARKKYLPWQGGSYGGSLTFEAGGTRYRIERTFGSTPRQDTFTLYDAATNRKSGRFSSEIGVELFGLDSESFERSTYLPQLYGDTTLSTDSIRAKLGNLVEDTNDINNFDRAMEALRRTRSTFLLFRGRGGLSAEAQDRISLVQTRLEEAQAGYAPLAAEQSRREALGNELEGHRAALAALRAEIARADREETRAALDSQYGSLREAEAGITRELVRLDAAYPRGLPPLADVDALSPLFDRAAALTASSDEPPEYRRARALLEAEATRFSGGVPAPEELEECRQACSRCLSLESSLQAAGLSLSDAAQLQELETFFAPGLPEEEWLSACGEWQRELTRLQNQREGLAAADPDQEQLQELEAFFSPGLPGEDACRDCRQQLSHISELRSRNARMMAGAAEAADASGDSTRASGHKRSSGVPFWIALAAGLGGAAAGGALLVWQQYAAGGILLAVGALFLMGAVYLRLTHLIRSTLPQTRSTLESDLRQALLENEQQAAKTEHALRTFLGRYFPDDPRSTTEQLTDLLARRETLLSLRGRREDRLARERELDARIRELQTLLADRLAPFFPASPLPEDALSLLQLRKSRLIDLRAQKLDSDARREALSRQLDILRTGVRAFLSAYGPAEDPARFERDLAQLQQDAAAYRQAEELCAAAQARAAAQAAELADCRSRIQAFAGQYGLSLSPEEPASIRALRDDVRRQEDLIARRQTASDALARFCTEHPDYAGHPDTGTEPDCPPSAPAFAADGSAERPDAAFLREEEARLIREIERCSGEIPLCEQRIRDLQELTDRIPALRDELEDWTQTRADALHKSDLLDRTMALLTQARDTLSSSYLGTIRERFAVYLHRLQAEAPDAVLVDTELQVRLERCGAARELSYFSAGQADLVQLCMRLALVDALFTEETPFLILDDPFVNLDDCHIQAGLRLLEELSRDHQILYLVCHSSRAVH